MPLKNNDIQSLFISVFSGLSYGVPIAVVAGILGELSATIRAFVSSSLVFGITFGALLTVILTEYLGRRLIVIISGFESFIFAALLSAMFQASAIIVLRLLQGVGIGCICTIACIYVMELASDKYKGTFVFLFQVSITCGNVIGYLLNVIFNYVSSGWRYEFAIAGLPILTLGIGGIFCQESPVWKQKKEIYKQKMIEKEHNQQQQMIDINNHNDNNNNQNIDQLTNFQTSYNMNNNVINNNENGNEIVNNIDQQNERNNQLLESKNKRFIQQQQEEEEEKEQTQFQQMMYNAKFLLANCRRELIVGAVLAFFDQFTGINVVIFYMPMILEMAKLTQRLKLLSVTLGIGVWNALLTLPPLILIEKTGRKSVLIAGSAMQTIGILLIAIGYLVPSLVNRNLQYVLAIPGLVIFIAGFEFGIGGVFYVLIAEMFPSKVAGVVSSMNMLIMYICTIIVVTIFEPLANATSAGAVFSGLAVINLLLLLFSIFIVRETKGKQLWKGSLEEGELHQDKINSEQLEQKNSDQMNQQDNQQQDLQEDCLQQKKHDGRENQVKNQMKFESEYTTEEYNVDDGSNKHLMNKNE